MPKLRIVFFGTPDFAVASLKTIHLNKACEIIGVVTVADKGVGRGRKISISAVKKYAVENELSLLQPSNLNDSGFVDTLKKLNADVFFVVAFRKLPEVIWKTPPLGTINLHASLLPDYRGAAPINWSIINGEKETGVTTFFIDDKIDCGEIIANKRISIEEEETAGELHDRLQEVGASLIDNTIDMLLSGTVVRVKQEVSVILKINKAPKIHKIDCKIDWNKESQQIADFIRGLSPYPVAYTEFIDSSGVIKSFKIFKASPKNNIDSKTCPGKINSDGKTNLIIETKNGSIEIKELQLAGKKRMKIEDYLRGNSWDNSWKLTDFLYK